MSAAPGRSSASDVHHPRGHRHDWRRAPSTLGTVSGPPPSGSRRSVPASWQPARLSATVSEPKTSSPPNTAAIAMLRPAPAPRRYRSISPSATIDPFQLGSSPATTRMSVDLPAPLGPVSTTTSPGETVKSHRAQHQQVPVSGIQAVHHERSLIACAEVGRQRQAHGSCRARTRTHRANRFTDSSPSQQPARPVDP